MGLAIIRAVADDVEIGPRDRHVGHAAPLYALAALSAVVPSRVEIEHRVEAGQLEDPCRSGSRLDDAQRAAALPAGAGARRRAPRARRSRESVTAERSIDESRRPSSSISRRRSTRTEGAVYASISPRSVTTYASPSCSIVVTDSIGVVTRYGAGRRAGPVRRRCAQRGEGVVAHDGRRVRACGEPAPARPEDHREDEARRSDDHQDHADRVDVDPGGRSRHGPGEDCADGDQDEAD